jgi:hypothetical protein
MRQQAVTQAVDLPTVVQVLHASREQPSVEQEHSLLPQRIASRALAAQALSRGMPLGRAETPCTVLQGQG